MNDIFHYLKFKDLSKDWEKFIFHWEKFVFHWQKRNLEHIGKSLYTAESLELGSALNNCIVYLIFYPSRQHVKWKQFKYKSAFNHDSMMNRKPT